LLVALAFDFQHIGDVNLVGFDCLSIVLLLFVMVVFVDYIFLNYSIQFGEVDIFYLWIVG
jgi:hypothetical protein